ncbi:MAG: hypothetical protein JJT85_05175 [Chromatiales bacterium]|nr:hypothetical protein [Chromatiales bacterium]
MHRSRPISGTDSIRPGAARLLLAALLLTALAVLASPPPALEGRYLGEGPTGMLELELRREDDGALRGMMSDGAMTFQVAGRQEGRQLSGQAFEPDSGEMLGFLAIIDPAGEWLAVALIPFDTNREPLPVLAETMAFRRIPPAD